MKKYLLLVATVFVLVVSLVMGVCAPKAAPPVKGWPKTISWGSASVGGAFYLWTATMGRAVDKYAGISCSNEPGGTRPSITMMSKREMHLSSNWMEFTRWAVFGMETYANQPVKNLRLLYRVNSAPCMMYGNAKLGIKSVKDLKGRRVRVEHPAAPLVGYGAKLMLKAGGITVADVISVKAPTIEDAHRGLQEGTTDVAMVLIAPSTPSFQELSRTMPIAIVPLSASEIEFIRKEAPGFVPYTVKAGSFPGCDKDIVVLASWSNVIALEELPEDLVYAIMKAIFEHLDEIQPAYAELASLTLENAPQSPAIPFHAGAVKYYKEKGVWTKELDGLQKSMLEELKK